MEKIQIIGNLGQDARVATVSNGDETANFSVGVNHKFKDAQGQQKETTTWYNCTIWKPNNVKSFLLKGQQVFIEGRPRVRMFDSRDGQKVACIDITVNNIVLVGKRADAPNTTTAAPPATAATTDPFDQVPDNAGDDVPF